MTTTPVNLLSIFEAAIKNNKDFNAFSDYDGQRFTYQEVGEKIQKIHAFFQTLGIQKGDKISLLGKNSSNWCIIYLATITYGTVIVPILPDFKPDDIHTIVTHSDSVILFVEDSMFKTLDPAAMPDIRLIFRIQDLNILFTKEPSWIEALTHSKTPAFETLCFPPALPDDVGVISYTSGTTGFSKGVVLQHKSLLGNIRYAQQNMPLNPKDKILSFLPLAHTYGCAFEFLFPFSLGCDITFLTRSPSPKVIMQAFQEIKPSLILSVPLVIEKIYKTRLRPVIRKPAMRILLQVPGINRFLLHKIKAKMVDVFGGNFRELVIGGAPFNKEAERFFRKMKFPFTVGYGMTECGPLISYASWKTTRLGASGRAVDELTVKIDSDNPLKEAGEILIRGNHVMSGYYKNEEATRAVLDGDGWLHSGDLGVIDRKGNIFIKGRSKSMILGPSGKNIYPEEIESILNNRFMVMESLIIERNHKLMALICPDFEAAEKAGVPKENLNEVFQGYLDDLNHRLPKYITIPDFEIHPEEFEKTPKRSIKRFLYQNK